MKKEMENTNFRRLVIDGLMEDYSFYFKHFGNSLLCGLNTDEWGNFGYFSCKEADFNNALEEKLNEISETKQKYTGARYTLSLKRDVSQYPTGLNYLEMQN